MNSKDSVTWNKGWGTVTAKESFFQNITLLCPKIDNSKTNEMIVSVSCPRLQTHITTNTRSPASTGVLKYNRQSKRKRAWVCGHVCTRHPFISASAFAQSFAWKEGQGILRSTPNPHFKRSDQFQAVLGSARGQSAQKRKPIPAKAR